MKTYGIKDVKDNNIVCAFCGKSQHEVSKMVSSPSQKVFICEKCIEVCHSLVSEEPSFAE